MDFKIIKSKARFCHTKEQWEYLLNNCANRDIFFTYQWFKCWINSFLPEEKMLLVTANSSDRLHAILPLMLSPYNIGSLQFNIIKSMTNKHSLRFDYLSDSPSPGQFAELLKRAFAETKSSMILLENVSEKSFIMNIPVICPGLWWLKNIRAGKTEL